MLSNAHLLAHESPYLNKGNTETLLRPGMTFTSEPGTLSLQFYSPFIIYSNRAKVFM